MKNSVFKLIISLTVVLYTSFVLFLIYKYGVNIPFHEEICLWQLKYQFETSGFELAPFLIPNSGGHRTLFPGVVYWWLLNEFDWNTKVGMYFTYINLILVAAICLGYLRRKAINVKSVWISAPVVFVIAMSLAQCDNIFWGYQMIFTTAVSLSVVTLFLYDCYLDNYSKIKCFYVCLCGFIASFSSAHGLLVWSSIWISMILGLMIHKKRINMGGFVILLWSIVVCLLYIHGNNIAHDIDISFKTIVFFFAIIGGWCSQNILVNSICGSLIIVFCIFSFYANRNSLHPFPIMMTVYGIAGALVLTYGRISFGLEHALSRTYVSITLMIPMGLFLLYMRRFDNCKSCFGDVTYVVSICSYFLFLSTSLSHVDAVLGQSKGRMEYKGFLLHDARDLSLSKRNQHGIPLDDEELEYLLKNIIP